MIKLINKCPDLQLLLNYCLKLLAVYVLKYFLKYLVFRFKVQADELAAVKQQLAVANTSLEKMKGMEAANEEITMLFAHLTLEHGIPNPLGEEEDEDQGAALLSV